MKRRRLSLAEYRRTLGIPVGVSNDEMIVTAKLYHSALAAIAEKGAETLVAINTGAPYEHLLDEFRAMVDALPPGEMRRVVVEVHADDFVRSATALAARLKDACSRDHAEGDGH